MRLLTVRCSGFGCAFHLPITSATSLTHFVDDLVAIALVGQVDGQPLVEERHLLQPAGDGFEVVFRGFRKQQGRPRTAPLTPSSWSAPALEAQGSDFSQT